MIEKAPAVHFSTKLFAIVNRPEVVLKIAAINNEYLYWDKLKYKKISDLAPEQLWSAVKMARAVNYKNISFGIYHFNYVTTDYIQKIIHYFDMNIGGYMGANNVVPEADKTRYLVSAIMEEAISSSQIEGANTTRKKAKEMLRKEVKPKTKSEQMIVNNYVTIKHITQNRNDDLTPEKLLYVHGLIACDTLDDKKEEGAFRISDDVQVVNHIDGEVVHTPPSHKELEILIKDLCDFFNADSKETFMHPILKATTIHFMIGYIHPFTDGNGRTARALFYWYLLKKGYWLTEYLSISKIIQDTKNQYEKAYLYTEADANDLTYFMTYHLKVMDKAFEALKEYIQLKQKENLQIASFVRIPNVNERQAQLLKILNDEPECIFTVKEVENRFQVSKYTARTDLNALVEMNFLEVIQVNKIKQNFVRSEKFLDLLAKYKIK
nr:Fic family protein [uncultured Flavobacterium sp.]